MTFAASSLPAAPSTRPFGFIAALAADGTSTWGRALTSPSGRVDINDIAVSSSGRTYVAGSFTYDLVLGGTCTWFDTAGASSGATCDAGHAQDDGFITAFDTAGAPDWARSFGGADGYDYAYGVATDSAGNVLIVGSFEAATNFGGGLLADPPARSDAFLVQYTAAGLHTRDTRYTSGGDTFVRGIAVGPANSTAIVGDFRGTVDFGAGPRVSSGNTDAFVVRLGS